MNDVKESSNSKNIQDLSKLFKEIQDIRYGRAKPEILENDRKKVKETPIYIFNKKTNIVGTILGISFLIIFATSIHCNYIFATTEKEKVAINNFEENDNTINMMEIISNNISETTKKEIITKEVEINYETVYIDNNKLPKGEEKIVQVGKFGSKEQTLIKSYENGEIVSENVINEKLLSNPISLVIEKGTSQFLFDKKVHIGDKMYTTADAKMYSSENTSSNEICTVIENIDVELKEEHDGWAYVSVDGMEGYIRGEYLTSEELTPGIAEIARKKRILLGVNIDMTLNCPSGLTKSDFVKVLSGNSRDVNHIFENNAGVFYEIEEKYNINGIFVASIAIHESGWGTSNIALQKKNLFGYGSYDSSAFSSSYTFESYQYGIETVAKVLSKYYLNEQGTQIYDWETAAGTYYNGPTLKGVNTRYASDQEWAEKVYNTMVSLYQRL